MINTIKKLFSFHYLAKLVTDLFETQRRPRTFKRIFSISDSGPEEVHTDNTLPGVVVRRQSCQVLKTVYGYKVIHFLFKNVMQGLLKMSL